MVKTTLSLGGERGRQDRPGSWEGRGNNTVSRGEGGQNNTVSLGRGESRATLLDWLRAGQHYFTVEQDNIFAGRGRLSPVTARHKGDCTHPVFVPVSAARATAVVTRTFQVKLGMLPVSLLSV